MTIEPADRRLHVPWWAVVVVGVWAALVLAYELLAAEHAPETGLCVFHRVTGAPCPTCGSTRALRSIIGGDVVGGFLSNPFIVAVGVLIVVWLVLRVGFGRRVVVSDRAARWLWLLAGAALMGNWLYLLLHDW